MGEVYKARDSRLDRAVAIKVLPEHIAGREDLRHRFEREARAVACLNHPHICVLHDIGNRDGMGYMVMEYLEGETLAARIERGALPVDEALRIGTQIADALDRAHRAGVTHRDIKPPNIMLTRDGVKVLDFGLAKSISTPGPSDETSTAELTTEGTVMGTPQYMAPEQFEGKTADARSDIWSFGAVLYEMVTGKKAFQGKSYPSLVVAIMSADPPPMTVKPFTPAYLERVVRRCLAKDPERRYQSIRDVALDLEMPTEQPGAPAPIDRWPWAVAAACLVTAVLGWGAWTRKPNEPALPAMFAVELPEGQRFTPVLNAGGSAISPDGRTLAFVATSAKGETLLWVRPMESLEARALPGTAEAGRPFWSPDSASLGFVAAGKLKRIFVAGGVPITLCDTFIGRGGTWNEDGTILFGDQLEGLTKVPASGGTPSPVTRINKAAGETAHYYPQFLPGGKKFLYLVRHTDAEKMGIYMGSLDGGPRDGTASTRVVQTQFKAAYDASSGRLLYMQGPGTLMAQRLELDPPRLKGNPATVAEGIGIGANTGYAEFSVSNSSTLFYVPGTGGGKIRLGWRDRAGKRLDTMGPAADKTRGEFSLSPDGSRVAYTVAANPGQNDVWVLDLALGVSRRITFSNATEPRWSPGGKHLYYTSPAGILRKAADGSADEELLMKGLGNEFLTSVSPDGKNLLYGFTDIMRLPLTGARKPEPYLQTKHQEGFASFSPDGRWVAYHSNESGQFEIYVQGFPERRGKWLVSTESGFMPKWRGDGKELYWHGPQSTLMAASVELQASGVRVVGHPEALFRVAGPFQPRSDGLRFLVSEPEGAERARTMMVQLNWVGRLGK